MNVVFVGYLTIIATEYIGLHHYLPIMRVLSFPLMLSFLLYVLSKYSLRDFLVNKQAKLLIFFIFLTSLSLIFGLIRSYAIDSIKAQVGYLLLSIVGFYLLNNYRRIVIFATFLVACHCYLVLCNFEKLLSLERRGDFKAGYFLSDGNDFAWSVCIALPFSLFIFSVSKSKLIKLTSIACSVLLVFGIIGTQSRGATLALAASLLYFWLKISRKKMIGLLVLLMLAFSIISFAPSSYLQRMETIKSYKEDSSAMGRINTWKRAIEMALDHPLLGVGAGSFNSAYGRYYKNVEEGDKARWMSAHSIYFLALGEYGFTGLGILLYLIFSIYKENMFLKNSIQMNQYKTEIPYHWLEFINMSLIAFAVAGIFLGGINYPHIYIIAMLTMNAKRIAFREIEEAHLDARSGALSIKEKL